MGFVVGFLDGSVKSSVVWFAEVKSQRGSSVSFWAYSAMSQCIGNTQAILQPHSVTLAALHERYKNSTFSGTHTTPQQCVSAIVDDT